MGTGKATGSSKEGQRRVSKTNSLNIYEDRTAKERIYFSKSGGNFL